MGKSGNPKTAADEARLTPNSAADFKKKRNGIFELPSGLMIRLRNPGGMGMFLKQGMIPNSLMPVVDKALKGEKPSTEDIMPTGGVDDSMVQDMMGLMNHIVVTCAVDPKVLPVPESEDDRDDELLYVDELEDNDKMFIFQWVTGGTSDLETFRQRHAENVAALGGSKPLGL